ncbi:MAG TPA: RNA-binding protein [Methanomassiliicoccales archaeon]|jgi:PUA domain protein
MSEIRIKKRGRLREKEIRSLSEEISSKVGMQVFTAKDTIDKAESSDFDVIFVNNEILALVISGKAFLTVKGVLKYDPPKSYVTVDMGAVPYVVKGADIMGPGIVDADKDIKPGDFVWVRDVKNKRALAIGEALVSGAEMLEKKSGKSIKNLHYVGDKLWKYDER